MLYLVVRLILRSRHEAYKAVNAPERLILRSRSEACTAEPTIYSFTECGKVIAAFKKGCQSFPLQVGEHLLR